METAVQSASVECPPGVVAAEINSNGEFVPASKWGVYLDGYIELREHLNKITPRLSKFRAPIGGQSA